MTRNALRLLLALLGSLGIALLSSTTSLLIACALSGLALLFALRRRQATARTLLQRWAALNLFVACVWLSLPWQLTAEGLRLDHEGVQAALHISLRSNAAGLLCIALLAGLDAFAVASAAAHLGLPARLVRLLLLTVRYLSVLQDSHARLHRAMQARGFKPRCDWHSCQVLALQVALILVHALLRAERTDLALRARGFAAFPPGTPAPILPSTRDLP